MKLLDFLKQTGNNELFRGSLILLILFNIGNVFSYLFQVSMARMLGPVDYGILAVLTSIFYVFSVPSTSIQTIVSKHTTRLFVKGDYGRMKGFFHFMISKMLVISIIVFFMFVILSFYLSKKLDISAWLLILAGTFLFGSFISPISVGMLQGIKKFSAWGWNSIGATLIKLLVAITLVSLGFRVYGAVIGFVIGGIFAFFFVFPFIRKITSAEKIDEKVNIFSKEIASTFLAVLFIVFIYSTDVIFARIFFSKEIAGIYGVISMIGKIILFGATGISNAMFPISSEKFVSGTGTRGVIKKALLAAGLWAGMLLAFFFIFPELVIRILFGEQYLLLKDVLIYVGVAFSFISFLNIFVLYKISTDKFKPKHILVLAIFWIIQMAILYFINGSIESFSIGFMVSTIITFIGSIVLIRK
jgi:O-antigen/teichoic acid export membrane protein